MAAVSTLVRVVIFGRSGGVICCMRRKNAGEVSCRNERCCEAMV
jgi:hypothetical protein